MSNTQRVAIITGASQGIGEGLVSAYRKLGYAVVANSRTITESDNTWFTLITMNQHPLHFDKEYAAKSEFKRPLVNSCLTLSMVVGMSVSDISQKAIGNLGWTDIKLPAPVFVGDTIYAESEVLAKRESASRPGQGLVTVRTIGKKADGTQFMSFERTALIAKRGHGIEE